MKNLFITVLTALSFLSAAQSNFQRKLYHTAPAGSLMEIIYSNEYNTSTFVIKNLNNGAQYTGFAELTKFTTTTGNVTSSKTFSVAGYDLILTDVVKNNQMLYMTARLTNSTGTVPCVIKYNLSTNATVWRRTLPSTIYPYSAVAYDTGANLFLLGSYFNNATTQTDLIVSKMDTNGVLIWTKDLGESTLNNSPGNIIYNGKRQVYITSVANVNSTSQSIILRLDSSGVILNSKILTAGSFPKFEKSFSAILKNKLVAIDRTIASGSFNPGPYHLRSLDTNLNATITKTINTSFKIESAFSNNTNLLLSGPIGTATVHKGFRTVRFDTLLNIAGSRSFNKINTLPVGGSSASFINSSNNSMHFFTPFSNDTVYVAKTDQFEAVNCRDSAYVPLVTTLNYSTSVFTFTTAVLTLTTTNITVPVANASYTSTSACTGLTTGVISRYDNAFISLYPNPTNSVLNINSEAELIAAMIIRDVTGKEIIAGKTSGQINVSSLEAGVYFISLYNESEKLVCIKKFIKQ